MNLDNSCILCRYDCPLKHQLNSFYEKHVHLNEQELYKAMHELTQHYLKDLKQQNMTDVSISLMDIKMHYTNCYVSKNQLIRDIRICTNLQRTLEINPTAKDINTWMKLSQLKMNLLNQIQHPETPDVPIEPYEFN